MLIDFDQPMLNMKGIVQRMPALDPKTNQPKRGPDGVVELGDPITLATVCCDALLYRSEKGLTGPEKAERFELGAKINMGGKIEFKAEEVAKLKKLIGREDLPLSTPLIVGQCYRMLEGQPNAIKPADKQL